MGKRNLSAAQREANRIREMERKKRIEISKIEKTID
jgi:hypothetical protein